MAATKNEGGRIITATPKKKAKVGADDLVILNPNVTRTIAGKVITIKEYDFLTGLEVRAAGKAFFDSVHTYANQGTIPNYEQMIGIFVEHRKILPRMIAIAADVEPEWIATLSDDDGTELLAAWWIVNGPFVFRKVMDRLRAEKDEQELLKKTDGQTFTPS